MSDETQTESPKRQMPRRIVTLPLPEPYDGFSVDGWVNYPPRLMADLGSGDLVRTNAAITQLVVGHDLVDFDGEPYPSADTPEFWAAIPTDLARIIIATIRDQVGRLDPRRSASS